MKNGQQSHKRNNVRFFLFDFLSFFFGRVTTSGKPADSGANLTGFGSAAPTVPAGANSGSEVTSTISGVRSTTSMSGRSSAKVGKADNR